MERVGEKDESPAWRIKIHRDVKIRVHQSKEILHTSAAEKSEKGQKRGFSSETEAEQTDELRKPR